MDADYALAFAEITQPDRVLYRDHLSKPFRCDGFDLATDGKCLLIVPSELSGAVDFGAREQMPPWRSVLRGLPGRPVAVTREQLDAWLQCERKTYTSCDNCDTSDGQLHCCDCDGSGFENVDVVCSVCGGEGVLSCGNHKPETLTDWTAGPFGRVGGVAMNRYMALSVLRHLAGPVVIYVGDPLDYIEFCSIDGWRFLLMPIRNDGPDAHEAPELEASP